MRLPLLGVIVALLILNACVAPPKKRIKPTLTPYTDAAPPDCETGSDFGDEPYDVTKPCHFRSTTKI